MSTHAPNLVPKSVNYSALPGDFVLVDATAAARTVTLPPPSPGRAPITVKKIDSSANTVTVSRLASPATIDGAITHVLATRYDTTTFVADGTNWQVFSQVKTVVPVVSFSPSEISGLKFWVKADGTLYQDSARTTLATADSAPVGSWTDLSAGAVHGAQATAGKRPLLRTNVFGTLPSVRFDLTDDCLQTAALDLSATDKVTAFVVFKQPNAGVRVLLEQGVAIDTAAGFGYYTSGNQLHSMMGLPASDYEFNVVSFDATAAVFTGKLDRSLGAGAEHVGYKNGGSPQGKAGPTVVGDTTGNFPSAVLNIGSRNNGAGFPSGADFGEIIIYDSLLSTVDMNRVGTYLQRWGTTWTTV